LTGRRHHRIVAMRGLTSQSVAPSHPTLRHTGVPIPSHYRKRYVWF
jgi:hypothetical protein